MLSRSFHNAMREVRDLGISTDSAILKHSEWMTDREINLIKRMEEKTMKKAVRRTVGNGNNARIANITSISYANGLNIKSMKKAPKVSDCKVFKLYRDDSIDDKRCITVKTFTIRNNGTAHFKVENEYAEWETETTIEEAREKYAKSLKQGYTKTEPKATDSKASSKKQTAKKSKKTDTKKSTKGGTKETAKKETKAKKETAKKTEKAKKETNSKVFILKKGNKMYRFTVTKNRGILVKGDGYRYVRTEEARWIYKRLLKEGYKRVV